MASRSGKGKPGSQPKIGPKKRSSGAKGGGRARSPGRSGARGGLRGALLRLSLTAVAAALTAGACLFGLLYNQALHDVQTRLGAPLWLNSGRVYSGPMELWPGLQISPEELAQDLQSAGYARVSKATQPGDFQLSDVDLLIHVPAAKGRGWATADTEAHVRFKEGRISAISPKARLQLAPAELAGLRGADNEARRPISLQELPKLVPQAVLAMEDARFYEHKGIDPVGLLRALVHNLRDQGGMQGGSTLTQQLTKNLFLNQERTVERKLREAILSLAIERSLSKDRILELYLNEIYLGEAGGASVCGLDQAARAYFGKPAARLSLGEAATLGGIVSAPNRYSPLRHPDRAKERRDLTLSRMEALGWASPAAVAAAKAEPLVAHPAQASRRAPYLVDAAVERVEALQGEGSTAARGLTIHTTAQPALQRIAERAVAEGGAALDAQHPKAKGAEIALVAVRVRDGAVVALVGGRSYAGSQFNRAVNARRQVGSITKPLTYLAAFEADRSLSPLSPIDDSPIERKVSGKSWKPANYDGQYKGIITIRQALAESRNVPAVLMAERVGHATLQRRNEALGLLDATALPAGALGAYLASPLEVAGAYTVFPGRGELAPPRLVEAVTDAEGRAVWQEEAMTLPRASPRAAFLATRLLEAVIEEGTGRSAAKAGLRGSVGGKTGTTDEAHDAWFVGFTPELAVAVWVGFDRGRDLGLTGGEAALPTWTRFVLASGTARGGFKAPEGVERLRVCASDHLPAVEGADCGPTYEEWVSAGSLDAPKRGPDGQVDAGGPVENALQSVKERLAPEAGKARRRWFGREEAEPEEPRIQPKR